MGYSRVVDQDVEAAERGYRLADGFLRAIGVRDVRNQGQNGVVPADGSDFVGSPPEPVFVDVEHGDAGPGPHEAERHGPTHAYGAARAGHDRDFPG